MRGFPRENQAVGHLKVPSFSFYSFFSERKSMNKQQLIEELAQSEKITQQMAKSVVDITFESMGDALAKGDRIEIRGFGSFKVKNYDGYEGRNPKTGEIIKVKPKKLPFFKVGKDLKERVDSI